MIYQNVSVSSFNTEPPLLLTVTRFVFPGGQRPRKDSKMDDIHTVSRVRDAVLQLFSFKQSKDGRVGNEAGE